MIQTPFYLIDKAKLLRNMEIIDRLRAGSGAKALLALKCFATWSAFDLMREHMDGTTSSSLYELRLGREKFGKETHAYSVAWADHEIEEAVGYADKIIFNSIGQLVRFGNQTRVVAPQTQRNAFQVALLDRDPVGLGADSKIGGLENAVAQRAEHLAGLLLDFVLFAPDKRNHIAQDVH